MLAVARVHVTHVKLRQGQDLVVYCSGKGLHYSRVPFAYRTNIVACPCDITLLNCYLVEWVQLTS